MNVYDFKVKARDGREVELKSFAGKVLLIVNTATECGFTPQYSDLQNMYAELHEQGLEILDFPCNQFYNQAPGNDEEIHTFCTGRYGVKFDQFSKIDVNGENAIPLYNWLTENTTFQGFSGPMEEILTPIVEQIDPDYKNNGKIKWNFTKFVIGKDGEIIARFEPTADASKVRDCILKVL